MNDSQRFAARSKKQGDREVRLDVARSVLLWIAEQVGFLLTRFEVGRDGKTAYERLGGESAKVQGLSLPEGIQWMRRRAERNF